MIVRVNVVLNRTVLVDSDWRFDYLCGSVVLIYRIKVICITSVDGILRRLLVWLVNYVAMLLANNNNLYLPYSSRLQGTGNC